MVGVVVWEGVSSEQFNILSGVCLGGICSSWFFNVYINGLIEDLEHSGYGCYFRVVLQVAFFMQTMSFCSSSVIKLQKMLDICYSNAVNWEFSFNNKKSCSTVFGQDYGYSVSDMMIGLDAIKWVDCCIYLSVGLKAGKTFATCAESNRHKFCSAVNNVINNGNFLYEECLMEIIQAQCVPILMYDAGVWKLNAESIRTLGITLNRAVKHVFCLHDYESVKDILFDFKMLSVNLNIDQACLLLCNNCLNSNRILVKMWAEYSRDSEGFLELLLKCGANYNLTKSYIRESVWKAFGNVVQWS